MTVGKDYHYYHNRRDLNPTLRSVAVIATFLVMNIILLQPSHTLAAVAATMALYATAAHHYCRTVMAFSSSSLTHHDVRVNPLMTNRDTRYAKSNDDEDDGDDDWRAFRAKLVMSENSPSSSSTSLASDEESTGGDVVVDDSDLDGIGALFSDTTTSSTDNTKSKFTLPDGFTPLDSSQWAYDSGKVIEKGAVILGGVEQDFGFGLRQQYFHKAVILVLEHDENTFTKGIILNRPSDQMMDDDVNDGVKWRVWFGGDVQGLDSLLPDIVCLHSLKSEAAKDASVTVVKGIQVSEYYHTCYEIAISSSSTQHATHITCNHQWTSFSNAKQLVKRGVASVEDFWLFAGYAGWGPRQLSGELDRKSWYMCATDSQTLLKELARQSYGIDPRDAGLETWELLMNMIGRGTTAEAVKSNFDDMMLKEWSRGNLLMKGGSEYGEIGMSRNPLKGLGSGEEIGNVDRLMKSAQDLVLEDKLSAGALLRASSAERSPFLLQKQEFHKSLVLVILEDDKATVGLMLNHPATKGCEVRIGMETTTIPLRYGGDYAVKGASPLMWLHCSKKLRDAGVGVAFSENHKDGIYKCSQDQASQALTAGIAHPKDFLAVSGVCVWPKLGGSLLSEVKRGVFDIIPKDRVEGAFTTLQEQEMLSATNLSRNLELTNLAWERAGAEDTQTQTKNTLTLGIGEGFDEDDDAVVFNSDKKVSDLADDALRKWVATFLLGAPTLA